MSKHVVAEQLPQAQHSAISPAQSSNAHTCRSERDNARKQTEWARASMSSRIYSSIFFPIFFFAGLFLYVRGSFVDYTLIFMFARAFLLKSQKHQHPAPTHVEVACCREFTAGKFTASAEQRSSSAQWSKARTYVRADQSATTQITRGSWRESHIVVEHIYIYNISPARCVIKSNEQIDICRAQKNVQQVTSSSS